MGEGCRRLADSKGFQNGIIGVIVLAGILVGLETSRPIMDAYGGLVHLLNTIVLWIFVVEIAVKMAARLPRPWDYFRDTWNIFDFAIVAVCFLPIHAEYVAVLRLVRLLRVLRLITVVPQLQMLVGALLKSIPSMGYVSLMLLLHFYIFAVMGVFFFGANDPVNFGGLVPTMLTLFQVVTLEGWVDVMQIQAQGSAAFPEVYASLGAVSTPHPVLAPLYFIFFILMGTMIMLNLFIGVIMNSMQEMHEEMTKETAEREEAAGGKTPDLELEEIAVALTALGERVEALKGRAFQRPKP